MYLYEINMNPGCGTLGGMLYLTQLNAEVKCTWFLEGNVMISLILKEEQV